MKMAVRMTLLSSVAACVLAACQSHAGAEQGSLHVSPGREHKEMGEFALPGEAAKWRQSGDGRWRWDEGSGDPVVHTFEQPFNENPEVGLAVRGDPGYDVSDLMSGIVALPSALRDGISMTVILGGSGPGDDDWLMRVGHVRIQWWVRSRRRQ